MFPEGRSKPFNFLTGIATGGREFGSTKNGKGGKLCESSTEAGLFQQSLAQQTVELLNALFQHLLTESPYLEH